MRADLKSEVVRALRAARDAVADEALKGSLDLFADEVERDLEVGEHVEVFCSDAAGDEWYLDAVVIGADFEGDQIALRDSDDNVLVADRSRLTRARP